MKHSFFVIEDHTLTNLGIRQIIQNSTDLACAGFASTEIEAFEKLTELDMKGSLPEVLILDLLLGEDSGIDVLREVNRHFPSIRVIVYSMYSNPGIVRLVLQCGAKGFVSKASSESELIEAIKKLSSGECETYVQSKLIEPLRTYSSICASLTKNEQAILNKLIEKKTLDDISEELDIPVHSIQNYITRVCEKTGCKNQEDLIAQFG